MRVLAGILRTLRPGGTRRRGGTRLPLSALVASVALASGLQASDAGAQVAPDDASIKAACVAAYDETQTLRQAGLLRAARDKALSCSQESCPAVVKKDCAQWLGELESSLPRVSFAVKDAAGNDTMAARVSLDGRPLLDRLDAAAVAVDPGERVFRVEIEGHPPQEQKVILREGEKGRVIEFSFADPASSPPGGAAPSEFTAEREGGGVPTASWVLGGVGLVGIGMFATFGALGLAEKSDAEAPGSGCAPGCADDEVSSIQTKFLVADISLGVGIAALGAAVIVAIVAGGGDGEQAASAVRVGAAPTPEGGFASVSGSF